MRPQFDLEPGTLGRRPGTLAGRGRGRLRVDPDQRPAGEATRISNRLRGLLTQIHPSLERVLGPRIQHPAVLLMLQQFGSPAQLRKAGRRRLVNLTRAKAPRMAERLTAAGFDVRVVAGAGHTIHRDDHSGFMRALDGWV